jgi:hemerythrin-like domain-containing protein
MASKANTARGRTKKAASTRTRRKSGGRQPKARTREATRSRRQRKTSNREGAIDQLVGGVRSTVGSVIDTVKEALSPEGERHRGPAHGKTSSELLREQHREVEQLFARALGTEDARTRRSALNEIRRKLEMHTSIEERVFYPAVKLLGEQGRGMALEAYEEHHVVKLVLRELPRLEPKSESFEAKMTVLKELVAHHVAEEENEMLPMAERELGRERSCELADRMAARAKD